jgi:hypothetical protein
MNPEIVRQVFNRLLPIWQGVDLAESNRVEDAQKNLGHCFSATHHMEKIRSAWPVIALAESVDRSTTSHRKSDLSEGFGSRHSDPFVLPHSLLSPSQFLPFLRTSEELVLAEQLAPLIVYWSRQTAARLLPGSERYRHLISAAFCVSIFSEDHIDPLDEWCFLLESAGLCLIVYGQQGNDKLEPSEGVRFIDGGEPHGSMVPRKPHPFNGQTGIALPEPEPGDR